MDEKLRDLLDAAAGDPPHPVTVESVRRRVVRRRARHVAGAAAAAVLVAGLAVAAAGLRGGSGPVSEHVPLAGAPRYYVEQGLRGTVVRATATGAVTATVRCPWRHAQIASGPALSPAGQQAIFMICEQTARRGSESVVTGSRIYRFRLAASGRVSGYSLVRGGVLGRHSVIEITGSSGGSEVAVALGPDAFGAARKGPALIVVINTRTGARAVWHGEEKSFVASDLTLTDGGRQLVFLGGPRCPPQPEFTSCQAIRQLRMVSPAAAGGQLASSHLLVRLSALSVPSGDDINAVRISADAATVTAVVIHAPGTPQRVTVSVIQFSASTGRQVRVLYQVRTGSGFAFNFFTADASGRYWLINVGPAGGPVNGRIDHGRLIRLTPASGNNVPYEVW